MGFCWESYYGVKDAVRNSIVADPMQINILLSFMDEWAEEERYEAMQAVFDAVEEFVHEYHPPDECADLVHPEHPEMSVIFPY